MIFTISQPINSILVRDLLFQLRGFAIVICFYLAWLTGKRIKEAGILSTMTGFMLYLIGNGIFQIGITIFTFYEDISVNQLIYTITNIIYLFTMTIFSFFQEWEVAHFPYPNILRTIPKYPYIKTIFSAIGFIGAMVAGSINSNLFGFGFAYMVIPFIYSSGAVFDKYKRLEMFHRHRPDFWFLLGLSLSGFSNFTFMLPIPFALILLLQSFSVIIGTIFMVKGWKAIPPLADLGWYLNLSQLLVIHRQQSVVLYSYNFKYNTEKTKTGKEDLAGGAFSGIQMLLKEILSSQNTINEIDHGDETIYFRHSDYFSFILITQGRSQEFLERLILFSQRFNEQFSENMTDWNGDASIFDDSGDIIQKTFLK